MRRKAEEIRKTGSGGKGKNGSDGETAIASSLPPDSLNSSRFISSRRRVEGRERISLPG
jgi:hypothetical protein